MSIPQIWYIAWVVKITKGGAGVNFLVRSFVDESSVFNRIVCEAVLHAHTFPSPAAAGK